MQGIYLSVSGNFRYHESNYDFTELYNEKAHLKAISSVDSLSPTFTLNLVASSQTWTVTPPNRILI